MALIELKDVTKKYDKSTTALRHIDLSVNSGEFVYLVGPSGAGKSSLIRLFYQEEKLTSGSMKVGEFDLTRLRKKDVPLLRRAIVNNPKVLIADEPTGNLDPEISWEIMQVLERINLQGTTILMATHNSTIVNNLRHRVVAIEEGRIVRDEEEGEYGYHD
ncbi:MAG: ATP-binding cassette domain-containing protein [Streptococcus salivarius]|nr:ATP-binding cassette domain-containing protein [Streptococcus salivarius]